MPVEQVKILTDVTIYSCDECKKIISKPDHFWWCSLCNAICCKDHVYYYFMDTDKEDICTNCRLKYIDTFSKVDILDEQIERLQDEKEELRGIIWNLINNKGA